MTFEKKSRHFHFPTVLMVEKFIGSIEPDFSQFSQILRTLKKIKGLPILYISMQYDYIITLLGFKSIWLKRKIIIRKLIHDYVCSYL